jgi:hypothetical protein
MTPPTNPQLMNSLAIPAACAVCINPPLPRSIYCARCRFIVQSTDHDKLKHPTKAGLVTISGNPSDDLAPGTLNSVLKQAGLKERKGGM